MATSAIPGAKPEPVPSTRSRPPIPNSLLAMVAFLGTEVMLFAALISSFLIVKADASIWPPLGQPRLPVNVTAFTTVLLLASGFAFYLANGRFRAGNFPGSRKLLGLAVLLGGIFVTVQGYEWAKLLGFGLTMTSSIYGSFFYMIIGFHALHAVAALVAMLHLYVTFGPQGQSASRFLGTQVFWYFVVGIWPILYYLVYLS